MRKGRSSYHEGIDYYMRSISKFPLLSKEEEQSLAKKSKRGDRQAERKMIECNLRLVVKVAGEFADMGVPIQDLINEGNIGLMKAVRKFDPAKGKLSTYAVWWIKQCIRRAVGKGNRTVRLPVHMHDKISKIRKVRAAMTEDLGREPSDEELSQETGIALGKISMMMGWGVGVASLDAPMSGEGQEVSLMDLLKDEGTAGPAFACQDSDMSDHVENLLGELRPREREIVCRRFGIGRDAETLEEIGADLKVTRERIRQIQADALRKMLESHRRSESRANRKQLTGSGGSI
jgi:RNA polymerase primary sigma factor